MSSLQDPPRFLASKESVPSVLRDGLELERGDAGPNPNHIGRLADELASRGPVAAATKTASWFSWSRALVLAGGGLLCVASFAVIRSKSMTAPNAPSMTLESPTLESPGPASPTLASPMIGAPLPTPESAPASDAPAVRADALPAAAASAPKPVVRPRTDRAAPSAPPAQKVAGDGTEIDLLARAHASLQSRPAEALALCEEHRETFANGRFTQEREALAIEALLYLHRRGDAERRWNDFQQRYPASNHRVHLADLFSSSAP